MKSLLLALVACLFSGCATLSTDPPLDIGEVHVRTGAERRPADPLSESEAAIYAEAVLPFARVASRAYCNYLRREGAAPEECDKTAPLEEQDGWQPLFDSREMLPPEDQFTRLTFLAFYRVHSSDPTSGDIVFGFRGTKPSYGSDWYANLRWITRFFPGQDQYDILYKHAPELIAKAYAKAGSLAPGVKRFSLYSTGHSLGGGLAQLFAYADERVQAAIVFDPSPVTGYNNVVEDDRVNCNARVLRVYERGEALQFLRSILRRLYTPTNNVAEVDFNLLHGGFNPIANHSIKTFTDKLTEALATVEQRMETPTLDRKERRVALEERLPKLPDETCFRLRKSSTTASQ